MRELLLLEQIAVIVGKVVYIENLFQHVDVNFNFFMSCFGFKMSNTP